jgi:hypothetical protein
VLLLLVTVAALRGLAVRYGQAGGACVHGA